MEQRDEVQNWVDHLLSMLNSDDGLEKYTAEISEKTESGVYLPMISKEKHGVSRNISLDEDLFRSSEYVAIGQLGDSLSGLIGDGAYIKRGDKTSEVSSFKQAFEWLLQEAKRGQHIQRYKGLGEMNPDQLWETTMDANTRRLLQVRIEDAIGADAIFTTLMGDHVEPRRDFIEHHALSVGKLDV
jgi:DNA gyrase subunit B